LKGHRKLLACLKAGPTVKISCTWGAGQGREEGKKSQDTR
jgi:hypothetical protein